jgi:NADH:ubiquinone oxidoreductase subunit 2 (subunit N)
MSAGLRLCWINIAGGKIFKKNCILAFIFVGLRLLNFFLINQILLFFICLERASLVLLTLIGLNSHYCESIMKYYFLNSFRTILITFGIRLTFFQGLSLFEFSFDTTNFGRFFFIFRLIIKRGILPVSMNLLDAYDYLPLSRFRFFNSVVKVLYLSLIIFIGINSLLFLINGIMEIFLICGFLNISFGTLMRLTQTKLKRFLLYSSFVYTGYVIISISLNTLTSNLARILFLVLYVCLFVVFRVILIKIDAKYYLIINVNLNYLRIRNVTTTTFYLVVFVISNFRIFPFFPMFRRKIFLTVNLLSRQMVGLAVFIFLNGLVTIFYYFNFLKIGLTKELHYR